jgi:hypothetical protein
MLPKTLGHVSVHRWSDATEYLHAWRGPAARNMPATEAMPRSRSERCFCWRKTAGLGEPEPAHSLSRPRCWLG